ncbi:MAG TPA: GntR family transcriptional regulator [Bradyrhizobium sp.]|jgi:DNA-binding GntR family transcriptional regulator|nr:GntR family transcriptional regulator [Rhizobiaceae bacterium]HUN95935.1 GntR family transcriptional regulator [Bradyrhizobium sp.]
MAPAEICAQLKEAILRQDYPPGSRLSEDDLARRFQVSRTPIREALKQLEIEGLVVRMRFHGGWVKQLRPEEVIELLDLREVLEGLLARLATERISEDALATLDGLLTEMRSSVAAGQYNAYLEQALKFRDILIEESRNNLLSAVARNMYDRMRLIGNRTVHLPGRAAAAIADHEKLLKAMHARDPERAEAINRERIKAIKRDAAKAFTESAFW